MIGDAATTATSDNWHWAEVRLVLSTAADNISAAAEALSSTLRRILDPWQDRFDFDVDLGVDAFVYWAHGEMLLLRATPPVPPRAPVQVLPSVARCRPRFAARAPGPRPVRARRRVAALLAERRVAA